MKKESDFSFQLYVIHCLNSNEVARLAANQNQKQKKCISLRKNKEFDCSKLTTRPSVVFKKNYKSNHKYGHGYFSNVLVC